jgi:hypothetical protein
VLAHWKKQGADMSLHQDTLSWFWANQSLLKLLNAACLAEMQQIPILLSRGDNSEHRLVLSFVSVNFYIVNISSVVKIRLLCYLGCLYANTTINIIFYFYNLMILLVQTYHHISTTYRIQIQKHPSLSYKRSHLLQWNRPYKIVAFFWGGFI